MTADPASFVRRHLTVEPVPFVPELSLYQAEEPIGLWELTEAYQALNCHDGDRPAECPHQA